MVKECMQKYQRNVIHEKSIWHRVNFTIYSLSSLCAPKLLANFI